MHSGLNSSSTLGIGVSLVEAVDICRRRIAGDAVASSFEVLNIAVPLGEAAPAELPDLIREAGMRAVAHAVNLNLSADVAESILVSLRATSGALGVDWYEEDLGIWQWNGMYLGSHLLGPFLDDASVVKTAQSIRKCQDFLCRPFLVENPPFYYAKGSLGLWEYMELVSDAADCGLVFDVGHAIGYCVNSGNEVLPPPHSWAGWGRVREIHLSGFDVLVVRGEPTWLDRHQLDFPPLLLEWAHHALACIPHSCVVTLELDGAPAVVRQRSVTAARQLLGRGA